MAVVGIIRSEAADGGPRLTLSFPRASVKGAGGVLTASLTEEGSLISGGAAPRRSAWRFESLGEGPDEAFLVGPGFEGESLDARESVAGGFPLLAAAARALELLSREGCLPRGLVSSGLLFGSGGEVLALPAAAAARALSARGPAARAAAVGRLVHHKSDGPEADASFLLAQAAYRFASGSNPYPREAAEAGSSAPPSPPVLPASLAAPRLDAEIAALIDAAMADPRTVPLARWVDALDRGAGSLWLRELPPDEEAELALRREAALSGARRKAAAASFLRRRGALIGGIAAAVAIAALFASSMLGRKAGLPDLSGLSPLQVAAAYYRALDALDADTMEAAADGTARKQDDSIAVNLTVLQKTRIAYESKDPLVKADRWIAAGKPPLDQTAMLFGVAGLELADAGGPTGRGIGATRRIEASYSLWYVEKSGPDLDAYSIPVEERRKDELTLQKTKAGWKIVAIERNAGEPAAWLPSAPAGGSPPAGNQPAP